MRRSRSGVGLAALALSAPATFPPSLPIYQTDVERPGEEHDDFRQLAAAGQSGYGDVGQLRVPGDARRRRRPRITRSLDAGLFGVRHRQRAVGSQAGVLRRRHDELRVPEQRLERDARARHADRDGHERLQLRSASSERERARLSHPHRPERRQRRWPRLDRRRRSRRFRRRARSFARFRSAAPCRAPAVFRSQCSSIRPPAIRSSSTRRARSRVSGSAGAVFVSSAQVNLANQNVSAVAEHAQSVRRRLVDHASRRRRDAADDGDQSVQRERQSQHHVLRSIADHEVHPARRRDDDAERDVHAERDPQPARPERDDDDQRDR